MIEMTLTGTGTSHGIPCIACKCDVCRSKDPHDRRLRCSAYVKVYNPDGSENYILIDIGPDFRMQALDYNIEAVDAVLITHGHADHLHGLDDIRIFSHTRSSGNLINPEVGKETEGEGLPVFSNEPCLKTIEKHFDYIFMETQIGGGKPKIRLVNSSEIEKSRPAEFGSASVTPVFMLHGKLEDTGWIISTEGKDGKRHSIAYLTDCSEIPEESIEKIKAQSGVLDHLVIDGLRIPQHATHFSFMDAMTAAEKLKPVHTWFTHICHESSHREIQAYADEALEKFPDLKKIVQAGGSVGPAWDGLVIKTE